MARLDQMLTQAQTQAAQKADRLARQARVQAATGAVVNAKAGVARAVATAQSRYFGLSALVARCPLIGGDSAEVADAKARHQTAMATLERERAA